MIDSTTQDRHRNDEYQLRRIIREGEKGPTNPDNYSIMTLRHN